MRRSNLTTVVYILITCLVFVNIFIYSKIITHSIPEAVYPSTSDSAADALDESSGTPDGEGVSAFAMPEGYRYITVNVSDTYSGPLILVNASHPYEFDNVPTAVAPDISDSVYYNKTSSYAAKDINVALNTTVIQALNRMMDDFYEIKGSRSVMINEGLRTREEQESILAQKIAELGEDQTIAAKPGYSEHHSGYAMDLLLYENGIAATFTGEGEYSWFSENAHKYGFILRYPEGKEDITGISYESWHFRYVGVPHAEYIYKNGLALEEYIEMLGFYPIESAKLAETDSVSGDNYVVYSAAVPSDGTQVPVPDGAAGEAYTISGDNNGHVIITVKQ